MPASSQAPRRKPGRPRTSRRGGKGNPREEIVAVASRLFAEKGVAATTMSEIAAAAGLRQPSVYYYFSGKDAILEEIVRDVNRVPLEQVRRIVAEGGPPAVRLYRIVRSDARTLCDFPFDINEIHRLSALRDARFAGYWEDRRELIAELEGLIREGVEAGDFVAVDPRLAALTVLANDEGTQNWYRPPTGRAAGAEPPGGYRPEEIGDFLAELTLRGLMRDPAALAQVREQATALGA